MKLSDKVRYLREIEGSLRGLDRAMTQGELVRALEETGGSTISQSYLSQIESGARPHLTNTTRLLLARFFKVHPGYLVEDPEDFQAELRTDLSEDKLDLWLVAGAERLGRRDGDLCRALLAVAHHEDSRRCLLLLEAILKTPQLADRLGAALGLPGKSKTTATADSFGMTTKKRKATATADSFGVATRKQATTKRAAKGKGGK